MDIRKVVSGVEAIKGGAKDVVSNIGSIPITRGGRRGVVVCAGGTRYFTNAWVMLKLLRKHECSLPVEMWVFDDSELDESMHRLATTMGVTICYAGKEFRKQAVKKVRGRWQWALKPYAILHSSFDEVLYLDADSFPVRDPSDLFDCEVYKAESSLFWPDVGMTEKERPIWEVMGVPYRVEPEFETGQMLINKGLCLEPLQLALWMNLQSEIYYDLIWGDKDTFRFAWHKLGRSFGMVPYPVQTLSFPGNPDSIAAMCQHDLDGNWLFQHRNMAKWSLLGENPRIPGFMFEPECRAFLKELRGLWNGRVAQASCLRSKRNQQSGCLSTKLDGAGGTPATHTGETPVVQARDLLAGVWLLEDRRPKVVEPDLPPVEWTDERQPLPWGAGAVAEQEVARVAKQPKHELRCPEVTFLPDSIGRGANEELCWWEVKTKGKEPVLELIGEDGVSARLKADGAGGWQGHWRQKGLDGRKYSCRLTRPEAIYPEKASAELLNGRTPSRSVHIANHAMGIGDAITGLYAAAGLAQAGVPVVYHTRHPEWLQRVKATGLTITDAEPPAGTVDLNADYPEQLRYASDKARWYAMLAAAGLRPGKRPGIAAPPFAPARPQVSRAVLEPVLDFPKYVLLAPFAAHVERDWPEAHWRRLVFLLNEAGYEAVALGVKKDEERLRQTFERSHAYWVLDQSPEWVAAAMLEAQCVIGPDSGMIHLAGLLGAPAICIHSHLPPAFLFSHAPSVFSATPTTQDAFCRWQEDKGYHESDEAGCSALATVSPDQVLKTLLSRKLKSARSRHHRQVERETKQVLRSADGRNSNRIQVSENKADVIAYTYKPDCGLGEAAEANIAAMRALGLTVEQRPWEHDLAVEPALRDPNQIYYHHWHPQSQDPFDKWRLYLPETGMGARHIAFWAYEIEGELPETFQRAAQFMTEIWTPSRFCQKLFAATGLPVHVVPHAVQARETLNELPSSGSQAPFTVLTLFDAWSRFARKNPEAVIRVFQKAFPHRLDVRLVLKGRHMSREQVKNLEADCGWDSRIKVMNQFLSESERDKLFASADVYLGLQRSEGFGLNLARSLGMGLPLITTGWSGLMDFCNEENCFLVPCRLTRTGDTAHDFPRTGVWAEPDEQAAAKLLSRVADMVARADHQLRKMREGGRVLIQDQFGETALRNHLGLRFSALGKGTGINSLHAR